MRPVHSCLHSLPYQWSFRRTTLTDRGFLLLGFPLPPLDWDDALPFLPIPVYPVLDDLPHDSFPGEISYFYASRKVGAIRQAFFDKTGYAKDWKEYPHRCQCVYRRTGANRGELRNSSRRVYTEKRGHLR
jgi:hypothetical protein